MLSQSTLYASLLTDEDLNQLIQSRVEEGRAVGIVLGILEAGVVIVLALTTF